MPRGLYLLTCCMAGLFSLVMVASAQAPVRTPTELIEYLHDALIDVMNDGESLGFSGRFERLKPVIEEVDDLPYIARLTMGNHWKALTNQQKTLFIETFSELSISTYASRFTRYSGQTFAITDVADLSRGGVQVRSILTGSRGKKTHLDYLLKQRNGQWKVINILAEGVSDLAVKQSEYSALLTDEGFDGLINKLKEKIASLQEGHE